MKAVIFTYAAIVIVIWIFIIAFALAAFKDIKEYIATKQHPEGVGYGFIFCSLFIIAMLAATVWPLAMAVMFLTIIIEKWRK